MSKSRNLSPVGNFLSLLQEIEKAEKSKSYKAILQYSLDAIVFLPSVILDSNHPVSVKKLAKPVRYTCNYLAVLQEEAELKALSKVLQRNFMPAEISAEAAAALKRLTIVEKVYQYLKKHPGSGLEAVCQKLDFDVEEIQSITKYGLELGLMEKTETGIKLNEKPPRLKNII